MTTLMRIIFMGSPDFAVPTLDAVIAAGHEVLCAYTQPPRPAGRGKALQPTAVERRARALGIEVRSPKSLRSEEAQADFAALDAEVAVVAAYGLILPQPILDAPRHGCLNVHGSLLPRWRGAAPVQRAIMAGDAVTGVTIMQMEAGLDTGPMLLAGELPIGDKNAAQVTKELAEFGANLMVEVLSDLTAFPPRPQPDEGVTYAAKISKDEARIDWSRPAIELKRHVQGLAPFPGAWFAVGEERVKVLAASIRRPGEGRDRSALETRRSVPSLTEAPASAGAAPGTVLDEWLGIQCGEDLLSPTLLQRAGKAPMNLAEFLRGFPIASGTVLE